MSADGRENPDSVIEGDCPESATAVEDAVVPAAAAETAPADPEQKCSGSQTDSSSEYGQLSVAEAARVSVTGDFCVWSS